VHREIKKNPVTASMSKRSEVGQGRFRPAHMHDQISEGRRRQASADEQSQLSVMGKRHSVSVNFHAAPLSLSGACPPS
jgi:hypothetical protein